MKQENTGFCKRCGSSLIGRRIDAKYCGKRCRLLATKRRIKIRQNKFVSGDIRLCSECGAEFKTRVPKHIFCSDKCQRASYKKRMAVIPKKKKCIVCGIDFMPNTPSHRICSNKCIRVRGRNSRLAANYGMVGDDFARLFNKQGSKCAICQTTDAKRWSVDHDHSCCSGEKTCGKCIRGILCFNCNLALGIFRDSTETISRALSYITKNKVKSNKDAE